MQFYDLELWYIGVYISEYKLTCWESGSKDSWSQRIKSDEKVDDAVVAFKQWVDQLEELVTNDQQSKSTKWNWPEGRLKPITKYNGTEKESTGEPSFDTNTFRQRISLAFKRRHIKPKPIGYGHGKLKRGHQGTTEKKETTTDVWSQTSP